MTYDLARKDDARIPVVVVELYLDTCSNVFGSAPCTASGAAGSECYNTFSTCQDTPNFLKGEKTYRFYQPVTNWPIGENGYPALVKEPSFTPCKIDPKGSLGLRGAVEIELFDFADDDLGTDPYVTTRPYNPEQQGTFFGKLKFRSNFYKGRLMKVRKGYLGLDGSFSWADFEDRLYVIDSIDYDQKGQVKIKGKDILKLTDDSKAIAPAANDGTLSVAMTTGSTTAVLQTGEGATYKDSGKVKIGDEIIEYNSITVDTINILSRQYHGSELDDHDIGDAVQQCLEYTTENVLDIIYELLIDYTDITADYIPYEGGINLVTNGRFDVDVSGWLSTNAAISLVGNAIQVQQTTGAEGSADQAITTVIGKEYTLIVEAKAGTAAFHDVGIGTTQSGKEILDTGNIASAVSFTKYSYIFTATATTTWISVYASGAVGENTLFDNISVKINAGSDEWDIEKASWLSANDLTYLVTAPTGIGTLISQLCKQNLIYMWFDEKSHKIKLRAIAPELKNAVPQSFNDSQHIIKDSIIVKDNDKERISQLWVYYDIKNIAGDIDSASNYGKLKVLVDTDSESPNANSEKAIKIIYANWLTSANTGLILTLAGRLLSRYSSTPQTTKFKLDMKDSDLWTGGIATLDSQAFQGADGANLIRKMQILKAYESHDKQVATLEAETWDYEVLRYGYIAIDLMGDYTGESLENQNNYGFIADDFGKYLNGDSAHLIA